MRAVSPCSLSEAIAYLARDPDLVPVAGATDLLVTSPERRYALDHVLDLLRIPEIRGITRENGRWRIGAATTMTEIGSHATLGAALPALALAARVVGGWQIQNRATLGGNMANASPAGDTLPVLLALDASVRLVGPAGEREVPYVEFHVGYRKTALLRGEIIGWVLVPDPPHGNVQFFRKVGTREAQAISKVVVAMSTRRDAGRLREVRVGAGSVAPVPVRLREVERVCEGEVADAALADRAAAAAAGEVTPIDDVRSTAAYRRFALARVVRRMVREASTTRVGSKGNSL